MNFGARVSCILVVEAGSSLRETRTPLRPLEAGQPKRSTDRFIAESFRRARILLRFSQGGYEISVTTAER